MSARSTRSTKSYKETQHIDPVELSEEIPYFRVASDVIVDVGDGFSAKYISYPYNSFSNGWVVDCIINNKYKRTMSLSWILNEQELVISYTQYVKQHYFVFYDHNQYILQLKQLIKAEIIIAKSMHNKGDIVLYLDAPDDVIDENGTLLLVIDTKDIKTFKCLAHMALTTKISHLDDSLNEPHLIEHAHFDRPGTLYPADIKSLVLRSEVRKLGDTAAKFKAIALQQKYELEEMTERYQNRVKVSELNVKGTFKNLSALLRKKLDVKKIGIVTSSGFPLSKSQFKYEIKKYCMDNMSLCDWKRLKYVEYHSLSLSQLTEIIGIKAVKLELDDNNNNNNNRNDDEAQSGRVVTWEAARIAYDFQKKEIYIKANLVRIDRNNKTVIGSRKQILRQRYLKKKDKDKKEQEKKENEDDSHQ